VGVAEPADRPLIPARVVVESVSAAGRSIEIARPGDAESLLSEEAFAENEFMPYWAELWPSGVELARDLLRRSLRGARVLDLGAGLGTVAVAAALAGGRVLATDWSQDALEWTRGNAERNGAHLETLWADWTAPDPLLARAPFDLVLAADVVYERRNVDALAPLLPRLAREVWLADPERPFLPDFLDAMAGAWTHEARPVAGTRVTVHRFRIRTQIPPTGVEPVLRE
jgi:predicted nicotinamide N-methyase